MAIFAYRATDSRGKVSEGVLDALEERVAAERLREMGYVPIRVWPAPTAPENRTAGLLSRRLPGRAARKDLLPFLQGLRTLLQAGIALDRSLEMLSRLFGGKAMGRVAETLLREVRGGSSLADAMEKAPGSPFDRFVVQMVNAGQTTGRLEEALDQAHRFLERSREFRANLKATLTYPAILLVASVISAAAMVAYVVPRFAAVFASSGATLPLPTRLLLAASGLVRGYGLYILGALVVASYVGSTALRRPEARREWDRRKLSWPFVGTIITAMETSRVTRSLASLLAGGVPILSAFAIAREVSGNGAIRDGMEAARTRVQGGAKVARALEETTPLPELALQMIAVGEETGRLETMLESVADNYEDAARRGLRNALTWLEPMVILGMGLLVGFIVFAIFLAVFRLNEVAL